MAAPASGFDLAAELAPARAMRFTEEPQLTLGAWRAWGGFAARKSAATPGRYLSSPAEEHRLIAYLTPAVPTDCACEGLRQVRVQAPFDFDLVPAGATGSWEDAAPMEMISLRLGPDLVAETAEALEVAGGCVELAPKLGGRDGLIEHIARAVQAELEAPEPAGRLYADSLAAALSARLLQNYAPAARSARQTLSKPQLRRLVEYVEINLAEDLSLSELARVVGLSIPHLTTLFRRTMGQTVHGYVMERRVCRARALLLDRSLSIPAAAYETGFAHPSHLARWMRRLLGVAPSEILRS